MAPDTHSLLHQLLVNFLGFAGGMGLAYMKPAL